MGLFSILKLSYSCIDNIAHNNTLLAQILPGATPPNTTVKVNAPAHYQEGRCLKKSVIYQARVTTTNKSQTVCHICRANRKLIQRETRQS